MDITDLRGKLRKERAQIISAADALKSLDRGKETRKVVDGLVRERELVEDAVVALDNLARCRGRRRGRRAAWIVEVQEAIKNR